MKKPVCPRCGFTFSFWRSLKYWNPYNTTCPQCGAKLRVRHVTVLLGLSGLCGVAIAGVAIVCEETRIWHSSDSLIFFAVAFPLIIVPWSVFLWSRSQYMLRTSSNQTLQPRIAATVGFVIGAALGLSGAHLFWMRTFRAAIPSALQSLEDRQQYSCAISLAALDRLETGETERAKLLLAREVASYYQHPFGRADSPQRKKLLSYIETVRSKSTTLNEELSKKAQ